MTEGCAIVAPDDFIHSVLGDDGPKETTIALIRFQELVVRGFIASSPKLKFCPYPGCTNTISCPSAPSSFVLSTLVIIASCGARGVLGSGSNKIRRRIRPRPRQRQQQRQRLRLLPLLQCRLSLCDEEHIFCFGCQFESHRRPLRCAVTRL
ncbi:hypothetical protein F5890DRAFT_144855 [Lentinula detonsa]|uniref:IBR domain-containing protein n=1 Tax=Lentinula detonsa TaxID=2804962 RepID=A0AA38PXW8_9AGAR|nr:hypothetical protein F5890DRAFT_144855 [Lentinula detonsa]